MEGFLHALYEYAQEKHVPSYLETWEYRRATCDLEEDWASFRSTVLVDHIQLEDILRSL